MTGLTKGKRAACILMAFITLIVGICFLCEKTDSVCMSSLPGGWSCNATIQKTLEVDLADMVIIRDKNVFLGSTISEAKPKHIQVRILEILRILSFAGMLTLISLSLLKTFGRVVSDTVVSVFLSIILFIHNKDGSKLIPA